MQNLPSKLLVRVNSTTLSLINYRLYSSKQTLYDVLNLKRDCSEQEIRNAFLRLSKENHPDMKRAAGGSRAENQKFIAILQAYQVLSKKDLRGQYDLDLQASERRSAYADKISNDMRQQNQYMRYGDFTPTADPNPGPYYGVKGISKVSNWNIAAILFGIAIVGAALQFFLIRHSFTLRRDALDEFSKEAGKSHANVRAEAEKYGNEKQLERLAAKFLQGGSR